MAPPCSESLLERLNGINSNIRFARVFWVREQVLVESDLVGQTIDGAEFDSACRAVATITDHVGPQLAKELMTNSAARSAARCLSLTVAAPPRPARSAR